MISSCEVFGYELRFEFEFLRILKKIAATKIDFQKMKSDKKKVHIKLI